MKDNKIIFQMTIPLMLVVLASTSCTFDIIDPPPPMKVALKSFHGRYNTAMGEYDAWANRHETDLGECGWFTQHHLANGKIALETCHGRYVTVPEGGTTRQAWMLEQESELGDCGEFDLYDLGGDRVAFKTCVGMFFTAGDDGLGWEEELEWAVVGETETLQDWEIFTKEEQ